MPYLLPLVTDSPERRDTVFETLRAAQVEAGTHYRPLHHYDTLVPHLVQRVPLPVTDDVAERVVTLPVHEGLSDQEVDHVVEVVAQAAVGTPLRSGAATDAGGEGRKPRS